MKTVTKSNGYHHGYKHLTIKNKKTGQVEHLRTTCNYFLRDEEKVKERIKREWSEGSYKVLRIQLT